MHYRLTRASLMMTCLGTLLITGCQGWQIPDSHQKPVVPPLVSEKPSLSPLEQLTIVPEESQLPFVVKTDLSPIQRTVRAAVPERIPDGRVEAGKTEDPAITSSSAWTFVRQGESEIKMQDGLVALHATYVGEPRSAAVPEVCRANPLPVSVDSTGEIRFEQRGERLLALYVPTNVTVGRPAAASPGTMPGCDINGLSPHQSAERWFEPAAVKQRISDSAAAESIALPVGTLWSDLSKPVTVAAPGAQGLLCLYAQPTQLTFGKPHGTSQETVLHGVVTHTPAASFEKECRRPQKHPVAVASSSGLQQSPRDSPYRMQASLAVPYAVLNEAVQRKLFHRTIRTDRSEPVLVETVTAAEANGRVLLSIDLSGGLKGTIYYWGTPQFQNHGRVVHMPDLEMAQESKRALDTFQLEYWQIIDHHLKDRLREAAKVDVGPRLDAMKRALTGAHKAGSMSIDLLVAQHHPQHAGATPDGLLAFYTFEGTASASGRMPLERMTRHYPVADPSSDAAPPAGTLSETNR